MQFTAYNKDHLKLTFQSPFGDIECHGAYAVVTDPLGVAHDIDPEALTDAHETSEALCAIVRAVCDHYKIQHPEALYVDPDRYVCLTWAYGINVFQETAGRWRSRGFDLEYPEDGDEWGIAKAEQSARWFRNMLHNVRRCMEVVR